MEIHSKADDHCFTEDSLRLLRISSRIVSCRFTVNLSFVAKHFKLICNPYVHRFFEVCKFVKRKSVNRKFLITEPPTPECRHDGCHLGFYTKFKFIGENGNCKCFFRVRNVFFLLLLVAFYKFFYTEKRRKIRIFVQT